MIAKKLKRISNRRPVLSNLMMMTWACRRLEFANYDMPKFWNLQTKRHFWKLFNEKSHRNAVAIEQQEIALKGFQFESSSFKLEAPNHQTACLQTWKSIANRFGLSNWTICIEILSKNERFCHSFWPKMPFERNPNPPDPNWIGSLNFEVLIRRSRMYAISTWNLEYKTFEPNYGRSASGTFGPRVVWIE